MDKTLDAVEKVESVDEPEEQAWEPPCRTLNLCHGDLVFDLERIRGLTENVIEACLGEYCEWVIFHDEDILYVVQDPERWKLLRAGGEIIGFRCPQCGYAIQVGDLAAKNYPLLACHECGRYIDASCIAAACRKG